MSETKLLQMSNITKAFASNVVLNGVDISVDEGEVVAILGENGAGKSTLIKILGGIYKADAGEIRIHGEIRNINSSAVAGENGIRIIHQEIVLVPDRTIAANVFLGREPKNKFGLVDVAEMERQTQKLIDDLHLNLRADQMVRSLTMGMQQLVEIIKAISADAKIVVMDEPTSSLSQGEVVLSAFSGKRISESFIYPIVWRNCSRSPTGLWYFVTEKWWEISVQKKRTETI